MELFLIISNSNESKEDIFAMFDDLRQYIEELGGFNFPKPEIRFLNKFIMSKHYGMAYYISKFYSNLYGNEFIRKSYRSFYHVRKSIDK